MYKLRSYQIKAVYEGLKFFYSNSKKNSYMVLPTGAGKSIVVAYIAKELDAPVLVLQPSKEILKQNFNKFISYGGEAKIYSASLDSKEIGRVTFATIGSIYKKPEQFSRFKYVIIDECHLVSPSKDSEKSSASMYVKFLSEIKVKLLGLTATPFRMRYYNFPEPYSTATMLHRIRPSVFKELIHVTQISELTGNKFWSPLHYIVREFDRSKLEKNSSNSNYTMESINKEVLSQGSVDAAIVYAKELRKEGRKKIVIFTSSIEISEYIASKLELHSVSSETKTEERDKHLKQFKAGKTWGLVNVNVLSVGVDEPGIDAIINLQPTMSLSRWYQITGRGVRISEEKENCVIVDLVGNYQSLGAIEDIKFSLVNGKWEVMCGDRMMSKVKLYSVKKIPEMDNEIVTYGKFSGQLYKSIPLWYLQFANQKLTETEESRELKKYANLKLK